jgi:phage baseplate assembly protein V
MSDILPDAITELFRRVADAERRLNNIMRPARVQKVNPEKGLVEVNYALDENQQDVSSIEIPWTERAGSIRTWMPPKKDEQVMIFSPGGEIGDASWVLTGGFSDKFKQPHNKEDEYKMQIGNTFLLKKKDEVYFEVDGTFKVKAKRIEFEKNQGGSSSGGGGFGGTPMAS